MVYCDRYLTVVVSEVAEVGNDAEKFLWITYKSGAKSKTGYSSPEELASTCKLLQSMLLQHNTGMTMEELIANGNVCEPSPVRGPEGAQGGEVGTQGGGLSLVDS